MNFKVFDWWVKCRLLKCKLNLAHVINFICVSGVSRDFVTTHHSITINILLYVLSNKNTKLRNSLIFYFTLLMNRQKEILVITSVHICIKKNYIHFVFMPRPKVNLDFEFEISKTDNKKYILLTITLLAIWLCGLSVVCTDWYEVTLKMQLNSINRIF